MNQLYILPCVLLYPPLTLCFVVLLVEHQHGDLLSEQGEFVLHHGDLEHGGRVRGHGRQRGAHRGQGHGLLVVRRGRLLATQFAGNQTQTVDRLLTRLLTRLKLRLVLGSVRIHTYKS
jgi:hypothetical protein